jgi:hypothetical protein
MLKNKTSYVDLGINYYDERRKKANINRYVKRLEAMGLTVKIEENVA